MKYKCSYIHWTKDAAECKNDATLECGECGDKYCDEHAEPGDDHGCAIAEIISIY